MVATAYHIIDEIGYVICLENKQSKATCPHCGTESDKLHQNHPLTVRDLPFCEHYVYLKINRRQFKCMGYGKKFSAEFNFIKKRSHFTDRVKQKIVEEILTSDIKNVAKRNGLSEQEVETIIKEAGANLVKRSQIT
jgi:transposase